MSRVLYRFKNVDDLDIVDNNIRPNNITEYVMDINGPIITKFLEFGKEHGLSIQDLDPKIEVHKDYSNMWMNTMCGISLRMNEDLATVFRLKFGVGDYNER